MISRAQIETMLEHHGPFILFIVGVVVGYFTPFPDNKLYLSSIATIGALLSSLTGVCISNFLSLKTDVADALRQRGYYKKMMKYAHRSVLLSLLLALFAVTGFIIPDNCGLIYNSILVGFLLSASGAFYRIFRLLCELGGMFWPPNEG